MMKRDGFPRTEISAKEAGPKLIRPNVHGGRKAKNWIQFVGTAGARFVVAKQLRSSGGLWLSLDSVNLYMDPGPGALVRCLENKLDPLQLDGILLSHKHLDHAGDINAMVEAMTEGGFQPRGTLFAPQDALEEDPVVFRYIRDYVAKVEILKERSDYSLKGLRFSTAGRHIHSVETYGFNFHVSGITISYITDTKFYSDLLVQYPGEILIFNVVLLSEVPERRIDHLSLEDVKWILVRSQAKGAVITHFGTRVLQAKPQGIAERLSAETGVRVIAAQDGMVLDIDQFLEEIAGQKGRTLEK